MGSFEATNVVLSKIKNFDPENASKIMGYLLMNLEDSELIRLACSPDSVLHTLVLRVKTHLGLTLSTPSSPSLPPSPLNPIARLAATSSNPFSRGNGFDFTRNPSSPSSHSHAWNFPNNNPISPKSTPLLSYDNLRALSPRVNGDCDFVDEQQVNEYFPFLNDSSKNEDLVDPRLELGVGAQNWHSADSHLHRRSFSASEVSFACDESAPGLGYKPCLYFARGFCKNGTNCKFLHGAFNDSVDAIVGSPSKFEGMEQREDFVRFKPSQLQRVASGPSSTAREKYYGFLMQESQRAAAAFMMGEELYNIGWDRPERNEFLAAISGDKPNSASRQIYLTFPAESTFKDEDVSEYFSKFGPVQDVRIPYQQKRMFGFVTFVYPETVRLILSKGNPHFICDSRVLVKPYKEKGKIPEKRQQHQQQQLDRGDLSPCLSPSGFGSKEPYDFHLGARMLYNPHDILLRRKIEEQAELQQVIELQERRLKNLQLPDFKNNPIHHHQRSLSVGPPLILPHQLHSHINDAGLSSDSKGDNTGYGGSFPSSNSLGIASENQQPQKEVDPADVDDSENGNVKDSGNKEGIDLSNSVEQALPDSLFASPTKAAGDYHADFSTMAEVNESAIFSASSSSHNKPEPMTTASSDVTSR
ncbi:hypothetical protein Fmac_001935 [Flemingia macrophylla]|uniref:Zinc finger CCCH domain-containing protein 55 n=1 Tax=Flemingia macrophylla TaxID=520843 RepID=A0ABD1NII0_9FABA